MNKPEKIGTLLPANSEQLGAAYYQHGTDCNTGTGWIVKPSNDLIPSKLSDKDLFAKCREYGLNAKMWARKFAGLLPEVSKRRLHRRKGFLSIHEFAAKLGGMSEYAVDRILALAKKLEDKPSLRKLFESGSEGWSKIEKVAYVATKETDDKWAEKVQALSLHALAAYVQNYRLKLPVDDEREHKSLLSQSAAAQDCLTKEGGYFHQGEEYVRFSFPVDKSVEFDLRIVKQNFEKKTKQNLTWNETFSMIVKENKQTKEQKCFKCTSKKGVVKICESCVKKIV